MRYYLIAGEASGDLHGSNLIKGLVAEDPEAQFRFRGGDLMAEAAGCSPVQHYRDGAVMGLGDVLAKAGKLLGSVSSCKKDIAAWNPDVLILIDYPGFNLRMAEFAHKRGLKVFYYIAPKTWASRSGRNRKLKKWVDRLFIIFPFEKPYFDKAGLKYTYAGNPLLDAVDLHRYSPVWTSPYVALLAGSRKGEISRMMPVCMRLADSFPDRKFIIAGAPARSAEDYEKYIQGRGNVSLVFGRTYDVLKYASAAVINSGTASLEAALIGTPQVVCWSTSEVTAFVAEKILHVLEHVKYISLANLILDKQIFKELIQRYFTLENVSRELSLLLEDKEYRNTMLEDYSKVREALGGTGASRAVARAMIEELR